MRWVERVALLVCGALAGVGVMLVAGGHTIHITSTTVARSTGVTQPGYVTDVPCYRALAFTTRGGGTSFIDIVYSGPGNLAYCRGGSPLDAMTVDGVALTEQPIDRLPVDAHYNCEASATPSTDPEDVMLLAYDNGTLISRHAAAGFCQGVREHRSDIVLTRR